MSCCARSGTLPSTATHLQIRNKAVAEARRQQIGDEKERNERALRANDRGAEQLARLAQLQRCQEVHALILSVFHEGVNPAHVPFHAAERLQMAHASGHHAWHARHSLQENDSG